MATPEQSSGSEEDSDPVADLGFSAAEADLLNAMLANLRPDAGALTGDEGVPEDDGWVEVTEDDPVMGVLENAQPIVRVPRPVTCIMCADPIWNADGSPVEATVRCSWSSCPGYSNPLHAACADGMQICGGCFVNMLVPAAGRDSPPGPRVPVAFPIHVQSGIWNPAHGVHQEGMLCYAAAVATACKCAGEPTTLLECMHNYAFSAKNVADWAQSYRDAFTAAEQAIGAERGDTSVDNVVQRMSRTNPGVYRSAIAGVGSPVFPVTIAGQVRNLSEGDMTSGMLFDLINANKVVMAGSKTHWVVIYACYGADRDHIKRIELYDPLGTGSVTTNGWPGDYDLFIAVG